MYLATARRTRRRPSVKLRAAIVRWIAASTTIVITVAAFGQVPALAAPADPLRPLGVQGEHVVTTTAGTPLPYSPDPAARRALSSAALKTTWPAAGSATVDLPASALDRSGAPTAIRAGTLPVEITAATPAHGASAAPTRVNVQVLDRAKSAAKLQDALLVRIGRADGASQPGRVGVSIDYSKFRNAVGGDWAWRLGLEALPDCALTTPAAVGCQGTVLPSHNNGSSVTATVTVGGSSTTSTDSASLLALTSGSSSAAGTFNATSLAPSGAWEAGGSSGDFSWSYNLRVPPALGGPEPTLSLGYSAQSVDGRMAASNNQPTWIGEGFDMWSGYIERSYKGCGDDMGGTANNTTKTGDECWATNNATMSLNGKTVELIRDDATGVWRPKADDGSRIEHLTGASNGDNDGEYWRVTTQNGTQYYFGLNRLPGWANGKPETNSTWTEPVFGNNTGEPCHQSTFDASWCSQAWRWNLDYVVDPHGNSMSYRYSTETNEYGRDLDPSKVSSYVRGGYLTEIDYGTRTEAEFGTAPMRVLFTVANRCLPNTTCDSTDPQDWPDVPWDQVCTGTSCSQASPTFFTMKRLSTVKTQVWGGSAYRDVESWTLNHTYPDPGDGTRAGLWLAGISHAGLVGGTVSVPDVTFTGVQMPNRVDTLTDGAPAMNWWRIASIRTETGGEISVQYSPQDCIAGSRMPSSPSTNTLRCYPVIWTPQGDTSPITDYFNKYVTMAVSETDHTGGAPRVLTSYNYIGDPAWHYTDDDGLTPANSRTWSQWRGYQTVAVTKGDTGDQSYGVTTYFRGIDGDHLPSGTRKVSVTDSFGGTWTDTDALTGQVLEQTTYNGPGGEVLSDVLSEPWMSAPTASRTINGVTEVARYTNIGVKDQRIALDGGRGWREIKSTTSYDQYGAVSQVENDGDVAEPGDDQCVLYTYARNTSAWLMSYPSQVQTYAGDCNTQPTSASQVIGDARTSYDGQAWGTAPTKGDITKVEALKDWSAGTPTYATTSVSTFDANGRIVDVQDVDGNHTKTAYTPATGGPVTATMQTNPLGWVTTTNLEPAWGLATSVIDQNNRRTDVIYDPLGRTTAVWLPGRVKGTQSANMTYAYSLSTTAPTAVTTSTLGPNGSYITSYALYDGLLRPRQTQTPAIGSAGGILVTDNFYDTAGRVAKSNSDYVVDGTPGTTLQIPSGDNAIAAQTRVLFDGSDRPIESMFYSFGVEKWHTLTVYGGDHTDVIPPPGGIATSTITDGLGRTVELRQYHDSTLSGAYDSTKYTYNAKGLPATVTDPEGNTWSYTYDTRGRQISVSDPDKGATTSTYDDAGRLLTTTDARGQTLAFTYDVLSRQTAEYSGSTSGTQLASWTYDNLAKGQLTSSTSFSGGNAYTSAITGYDAMYRPTGTKITIPASEGTLAGTYQFNTTYKPDGSVSSTTLPAAGGLAQETVNYTYTDTGQLNTVKGASSYLTQSQYTRLGEPAVYTLSTGGPIAQIGYTYDEATRRLTRIQDIRQTTPSTIADVNLTYNPAGDVTQIADTPASGTADTQCFTYDYQRRLTQAWTPASGDCTTAPDSGSLGGPAPYWQSYNYNTIGNRTALVDHSAGGDTTTSYTYPAAKAPQPHAVQTSTAGSFIYDPAGHTLTRPLPSGSAQTLTWNPQGQLATVSDSTGASTYVYDASGNRLISHDPTGATLHLPGMEIRATNGNTSTSCTRYYSAGSALIAQRTSSGVTWLMSDEQGTSQISVDSATQTVTERRQKPFGDPRGTTPTWVNPHGFVGGVNDPTGLVHLGAREYDPAGGRFISGDPVLDPNDPQQMNEYAYAADSPISNSDASGERYVPNAWVGGGGNNNSGGGGNNSTNSPTPPPTNTPAPTKPTTTSCGWLDVVCGLHAGKQVFDAGVNWAEQHPAQVWGTVAGTVVGLGCGALIGVTGVGAVACGFVGGAVSSLLTDAIEGGHSAGQIVIDTLVGGLTGALTAGVLSVGGQALGAGVKALVGGSGLGSALRAAGSAGLDEAGNIIGGKITGGLIGKALTSGATNTGTVWDSIKGTQPNIPNTPVPRSFELNTDGAKVWVRPSVTKHIAEYLQSVVNRGGGMAEINMAAQAELTSLQAAIGYATQDGVPLGQRLMSGGWELQFGQRSTDPLPVLFHGLYTGR